MLHMVEGLVIPMENPLTDLKAMTLTMHELYMELVEAGFTEEQALDLLKTMLLTNNPD